MKAEFLLEGATLSYRDPRGKTQWNVSVPDLVLIAEYTTDYGPWGEDYFLVFWTREDGKLFTATCPAAANSSAIFDQLTITCGDELQLGLLNSTEWKSRVVWPRELVGQDYFTFTQARSEKWLTSLWYRVMGTQDYQPTISVVDFLRSGDPSEV